MVLDGEPQSEAAWRNGMDRETLRDWVHHYNESGNRGITPGCYRVTRVGRGSG
jgi:transposase-like protein